jgi:hypothetical protein
MRRVFDHRDISGSPKKRRHVGHLSEQVHNHYSGKTSTRGLQRFRIDGQESRVDIDKNWPMAGSDYCPDKRRICEQGEGYSRSRLEVEAAE